MIHNSVSAKHLGQGRHVLDIIYYFKSAEIRGKSYSHDLSIMKKCSIGYNITDYYRLYRTLNWTTLMYKLSRSYTGNKKLKLQWAI